MGLHVSVEGLDEVGKTSFIKFLVGELKDRHPDKTVVSVNHWGTALGAEVYKQHQSGQLDAKYASLLCIALRYQVLAEHQDADYVVFDRGMVSTYAYGAVVDNDTRKPDVVVYVTAPERIIERELSELDVINRTKKDEIRKRYESFLAHMDSVGTRVIPIHNAGSIDDLKAMAVGVVDQL